jgi:hypothetical protein
MTGDLPKHRQAQALRGRVRLLRDEMNAAKLAYLSAQLELRALQGNDVASDRITRQIRNLLNMARPKAARKTRG